MWPTFCSHTVPELTVQASYRITSSSFDSVSVDGAQCSMIRLIAHRARRRARKSPRKATWLWEVKQTCKAFVRFVLPADLDPQRAARVKLPPLQGSRAGPSLLHLLHRGKNGPTCLERERNGGLYLSSTLPEPQCAANPVRKVFHGTIAIRARSL